VRYALSPYIKQTRFVFKGLMNMCTSLSCTYCSLPKFLYKALLYVLCKDLLVADNFSAGIYILKIVVKNKQFIISKLFVLLETQARNGCSW
jgi:hypothetical protein